MITRHDLDKRFLLFAWEDYYPEGGIHDFVHSYHEKTDGLRKIREIIKSDNESNERDRTNFQIVDWVTKEIVNLRYYDDKLEIDTRFEK